MPLREADMSATTIDDGSLTPLDDSAPGSRVQREGGRSGPSSTPRSPQPRLVLFDPRSGEQETIDLGSASSILTLDDYKRINRKTTERGMITGLVGGGVLTYLVRRFLPKTPSRNALSLTFIFSSAFISFSTSRALLVSEILRIRSQARANALANGDMSDNAPPSDPMFSGADLFGGTSPGQLRSPEGEASRQSRGRYVPPGYNRNRNDDEISAAAPGGPETITGRTQQQGQGQGGRMRGSVQDELNKIGQPPQRTRWAKGKGLEGEVEEENEMRDPYATAGQPRLG
ncbi:uncharacterized protein IL334_003901 [Kwoniella shivajii]|uniref:Uncharacterized protein n=1 Tax=Kwoniella shivajii TaxID=564305 RepID=A0ABZ1D1W1_9TREE|nr:hypothetical protein IL334_003901 [Kwoniella shivajii]